jgi:hypothetical protein
MIKRYGTIIHGHKTFSQDFCILAFELMKPQNKLNRGYGAECFDCKLSLSMITEIKEVFEKAREAIEIPSLVIRNSVEILKYKPGMKLDRHYDIPYCKDDFYPFITVINLNDEYEGGLYFDCEDLPVTGTGSFVLSPSSFLHTHSVKEIKGADRYSMLLDITYLEMLNKCTEPQNWFKV